MDREAYEALGTITMHSDIRRQPRCDDGIGLLSRTGLFDVTAATRPTQS